MRTESAGFERLWISDHFHPWNDEQGTPHTFRGTRNHGRFSFRGPATLFGPANVTSKLLRSLRSRLTWPGSTRQPEGPNARCVTGSRAVELDHQRPVIGDRHQLSLGGTAVQATVVGQDVIELTVWGGRRKLRGHR